MFDLMFQLIKNKFTQPSVTEVRLSLKEQTELKAKVTECRKKEQDEIKKITACRNSILEEFKKICIQTADKDGIKKDILFTVSNNLINCVDDSGNVTDRVIKAIPNDILRLCLGNDKTVDFRTNYSRTFNNSRLEIHFRAI
ncbi:MAG: hypothetical protein Terrestrivirus12_17 [Terrestrivirus sp.]|uniref:Uncharacterized protein n=1 Tax=Terrestrivirus sp. TaxID=2487775 RepID=A0A3G4ZQV8_9VIRU|nr:MAG: hypothetical protein Terrestrivirus12_17 [Terrestrivirus sp.]